MKKKCTAQLLGESKTAYDNRGGKLMIHKNILRILTAVVLLALLHQHDGSGVLGGR